MGNIENEFKKWVSHISVCERARVYAQGHNKT